MKEELFAELLESANQALDHARGKRELRTTVLPAPPEPMDAEDVKRLREQLHASQSVFAYYLNVSTKLVQAWEAERRAPEGPALRLLRIGEKFPDLVFGDVAAVQLKRHAHSTSYERSPGTVDTAPLKRPAARSRTKVTRSESAAKESAQALTAGRRSRT